MVVEIIENALQMVVAGACFFYSVIETMRTKSRAWIILMLFFAELFLGNLYWQLYLAFFGENPQFPFQSEFCWDVSFGFLLLLARCFSRGRISIKKDPVLIVIPIYTASWAIFYMNWGRYADNVICAILMAALILRCVYSLKSIKGRYEGAESVDHSTVKLYMAILLFCTAEYLSWTASCFFFADSFKSPYIWADFMVTISFVLLIPAVKACNPGAYGSLPGED